MGRPVAGDAAAQRSRFPWASIRSGAATLSAMTGCVGLGPIEPEGCCEMQRLYVSPRARAPGLGRALVAAVIGKAVQMGYHEMRLDTLPTMTEAISLYKKAGFVPMDPYDETPIADTFPWRNRSRPDTAHRHPRPLAHSVPAQLSFDQLLGCGRLDRAIGTPTADRKPAPNVPW
jgi:Acetyltransferase (GNAT) family